jgi:hypothetical protein
VRNHEVVKFFDFHIQFENGGDYVDDDKRSGLTVTHRTDENVENLQHLFH